MMTVDEKVAIVTATVHMEAAGEADRQGGKAWRDAQLAMAAAAYRRAGWEHAAALADRYRAMPVGITA